VAHDKKTKPTQFLSPKELIINYFNASSDVPGICCLVLPLFFLDFLKVVPDTKSQWASFSKKLQKLIILDPVHIFLFPIQGKGKIAREIRIWREKFEKSSFSGSNRPLCGFDHNDRSH
jgi:hypothetical protein